MKNQGTKIVNQVKAIKDNLLNTPEESIYLICVGGCGVLESVDHLFFRCHSFAKIWGELINWLGIFEVFGSGGLDHLIQFQGLSAGGNMMQRGNILILGALI